MPSKRYRDDSYSGKDRIPFESASDSDIDMRSGQLFDRRRRRRSSSSNARPESTRSPTRNDRRSEPGFGRDDTHSRDANNFIPGLSSFGSQAEYFRPQSQSKPAHDAPHRYEEDPYWQPTTARRRSSSEWRPSSAWKKSSSARRRSPSPRTKSFSASQATTAYDRSLSSQHDPQSTSSRAKLLETQYDSSDERSDLRSGSCCTNRLALPYEKDQHGTHFKLWRIRDPVGETVKWERIIRRR